MRPRAEDHPLPDTTDPLLADLTQPQREAVQCTEGPLLVLAAAGSGKTRVITRRIVHLVRAGVPAWSILALTFTNKAAGEMRSRVETLLGPVDGAPAGRAARGLTVTTFHALCARLLRRYAPVAAPGGLTAQFTIYDTPDQSALMKRVLAELQLSTTNWPPRSVLAAISRAKNDLVDAERYAAGARDFYTKTVSKAYTAYQRALRGANAVDFDDLLVLTAAMLRDNARVRGECQARWRYLLIDEYQDTNRAQFEIARLLAGGIAVPAGDPAAPKSGGAGPNICVVGDPDQSIYGWRGADISNILDFETHYPAARVIKLGENFRSTAPILAAADTLIRNNVRRKHKDLFTRRQGGDNVRVVLCRDEQHEAALIVDWFKALHERDAPEGGDGSETLAWRDMAVFYRTNALSRVMEDGLRAAGIPYVIARGTAFYEREEVRSALAYLRVVANPADDVSLERIVNTPSRGIGDASLERIAVFSRSAGITLFEGLRRAGEAGDLSARARAAVVRFVEMVDEWTGGGSFMGAGVPGSLADLVLRIIKESGLEKMYQDQARASGSEADEERLENLSEVVSSAAQFELEYDAAADPANAGGTGLRPVDQPQAPPLLAMLRAYLESVSLVADADTLDPAQGAVSLMTLHAAKGLEFPAAAIIGLEEGMLPHQRVLADTTGAELEEERRLCFVGMTRAMRRLTMTAAAVRTIRGVPERTIPSRFLGELGRGHVTVSDQSDELGGLDDFTRRGEPRAGATGTPAPNGLAAKFPVGSRVRHPQFGLGEVVSVTGGLQARAQIRFRDVGVKTLILEYARLQRV